MSVCFCCAAYPAEAGTEEWIVERDPCDTHMYPDLGWLQQYLEVGFFSDFKVQAWRYFLYNETSYAFLWINSIAYGNLDFVREACPEAAQLTLLLRAEERLPIKDAEIPLLDYAGMAAEARTAGAERRAESWPLRLGVERLRGLARNLAAPEELTVDVVMPYCAEPLDGLASLSTGYDDAWLSSPVPFGHTRLMLYRLLVCAGADGRGYEGSSIKELPPRAAAAVAIFRSVEVVPVDASPAAWEVARYLLHLVHRYHQLADFTLFLHPDVFEHVNPRTLKNVLQALRVGSFRQSGLGPAPAAGTSGAQVPPAWWEFVSLSHHYLTRPSRARSPSTDCTGKEEAFRELHRTLFGTGAAEATDAGADLAESDLPGNFGFYCCSQFMVHRDAVHRRPREWYEHVAQSIAWEHCTTSYMELVWHGVFSSGRLHERKRQERPELPLFLRVDNFIEVTSDGLV